MMQAHKTYNTALAQIWSDELVWRVKGITQRVHGEHRVHVWVQTPTHALSQLEPQTLK